MSAPRHAGRAAPALDELVADLASAHRPTGPLHVVTGPDDTRPTDGPASLDAYPRQPAGPGDPFGDRQRPRREDRYPAELLDVWAD